MGEHSKLYELLKASKVGTQRKKVVLLGSGYVPSCSALAKLTDCNVAPDWSQGPPSSFSLPEQISTWSSVRPSPFDV